MTENSGDIDLTLIQAKPVVKDDSQGYEDSRDLAKRESEEYYGKESNQVRVSLEKEQLEGRRQDRTERQKYARHLFCLICTWLVGVYLILILDGINESKIRISPRNDINVENVEIVAKFDLPDTVILALIGGTTINILGLFVIVANYLFNSNKK